MRSRPRLTIALAMVLSACSAVSSAAPGDAGRRPIPVRVPEVITPVVATALAVPHRVDGADGRVHLRYELFVTNPTGSVMTITRVETLDVSKSEVTDPSPSHPKVIGVLKGAELDAAIDPLVPAATNDVQPASVTRILLDATFRRGARLPSIIEHRFSISLKPATGAAQRSEVITGRTPVASGEAVVVGPPLEGGRWVVGGGCCFPPSYHRAATLPVNGAFHAPERFAIDFVQLNARNKLFSGPADQLSSYAYFGDHILSVADGVVVRLQDGLPEQTPPNLPTGATAETAGGNYVVVDIGHGRFAFYAHMQPGSLRVKLGERVRRGEVLGLLGNTGNSSGPHLHFHVMDGPGPLTSNGLPFEIRSFKSEGIVTTPINELENGAAATIGPASAGQHHRQLPLENEVISFPA